MNLGDGTAVKSLGLESAISYEQLIHCMRCGLCLPTCPTYALHLDEKESPRGRLALMRAVEEGRLETTDGFAQAMTLCLGCLACQTACPAGVQYGQLFELARERVEIHQKAQRGILFQWAIDLVLSGLLSGPHGLEPFLPLIRLYQKMGLHRLNLARLLPGSLGSWEQMLPNVPPHSTHQALGKLVQAIPPEIGRVGLLTGCLENGLLSNMGIATSRVLSLNGFSVVIPPQQACCGALPAHIGEMEIARREARQNIDVFEQAGVDLVISDAAGCSAQLKDYGRLLADDPVYRDRAARFVSNARDICEFLAGHLPLRGKLNRLNLRVAYDDPCHLVHAQNIFLQPRELLRSIPGVELVELPESTWCCGSAGTYNLTHVQEASALLARKMKFLKEMQVDVLATANTGCYIQLTAGVHQFGLDIQVAHVIELVSRAYEKDNYQEG
jgi:glycolate oxidase iron-sulfur subunit